MELQASKGKTHVYAVVSGDLCTLATQRVWLWKELLMEGKGGESKWSNSKAK